MTEKTRRYGVLSWLTSSTDGADPSTRSVELEAMVKPYTEVILRTRTPPSTDARIEVTGWDDLVKASDTLGKPIMRCSDGPNDPGQLFYVVDSGTTYVYDHRPRSVDAVAAASPTADGTLVPGPLSETGPAPEEPPSIQAAAEHARRLLVRLKDVPPQSRVAREAAPEIEVALRLLKEDHPGEAERHLSEAERVLDSGGTLDS